MNKKQIMKEQKKIKRERREVASLFSSNNDMYSNLIKVTAGVLLFLLISFCFVNIVKGKWNLFSRKNIETEKIDSSMVMFGTMFNKEEDTEYLVLAYDMRENKDIYYNYLAGNYSGSTHLYKLDLSSGFNASFIGDKEVISNNFTELKVTGPTLFVIKNDKILKSFNTEEKITEYLNNK